jgi:hypothetical protein
VSAKAYGLEMAIEDDYHVVDYHFIDDSRCLRPLSEAVQEPLSSDPGSAQGGEEELRVELGSLFRDAGWEGDGEINCIFMAPCFVGREDGWCSIVYHVKQSNNGTSWLAIPNDMQLRLPDGWLSKS